MIITTKRHNQIVEDLKKNYEKRIEYSIEELKKIYEKKIEQARDLKDILQKINIKSENTLTISSDTLKWATTSIGCQLDLPENVLVYVDDLLGGKVIKQEGTKCIVIEQDGSVKTGLTKSDADKGFNYKLIRK